MNEIKELFNKIIPLRTHLETHPSNIRMHSSCTKPRLINGSLFHLITILLKDFSQTKKRSTTNLNFLHNDLSKPPPRASASLSVSVRGRSCSGVCCTSYCPTGPSPSSFVFPFFL